MIEVRLAREACIDWVTYQAGEHVFVSPSTARALVQSGRARLVDASDLALLIEADRPRRLPIVGRFTMTR